MKGKYYFVFIKRLAKQLNIKIIQAYTTVDLADIDIMLNSPKQPEASVSKKRLSKMDKRHISTEKQQKHGEKNNKFF
jgi:hypothetical protein